MKPAVHERRKQMKRSTRLNALSVLSIFALSLTKRFFTLTILLAIVLIARPAFSADICAVLLSQGIRDTSSQQITESRFNELKSHVCNSSFDSYSKAATQAASGGFDVPGIFGISFGSANAESEYSTKWRNFCQSDYGLAISNSDLRTYFSTANRAVLNSFDNCVNVTSERFIRYVQPQSDGRTFSITFDNKRQGNSTFRVLAISLTNSTTSQTLNVLQSCDVPPPFNRPFPWNTGVPAMNTNAFSIVCRKNANDSIVVGGTTSAGNIDPVVVPAVPNAGPTIGDRVSALEANLSTAVPKGAILSWFVKGGSIPAGWTVCDGTNGPDLRNFFIRGASALSDLNDTKQGKNSHSHSVNQLTTGTPLGNPNIHVKQEAPAPLTVYGTDHKHQISPFDTKPADNMPEYKNVLFLCR
jgi:hypothetical protein